MFSQPAPASLPTTCCMSQGARNCGFFHVHGPPGPGGREQQIGLPGEKGGDLQQVAHLAHGRGLMRFVNVGGDRQAGAPV